MATRLPRGLPPYVEPCSPGLMVSMISSSHSTADTWERESVLPNCSPRTRGPVRREQTFPSPQGSGRELQQQDCPSATFTAGQARTPSAPPSTWHTSPSTKQQHWDQDASCFCSD